MILATSLAVLFRFFKQPTILAYLIAGACAGIFGYGQITGHKEVFELFSELGIVFLLFLVGLEINYFTLRSVGKDASFIGIGQVIFTSFLGFLLALALSFTHIEALYIGFSLMLSSTIIVVNTLSERKELQSVYGKVSLGILLIQDFFALLALIVQGGFREGALLGNGSGMLVFALGFAQRHRRSNMRQSSCRLYLTQLGYKNGC
jgi:Kef-type K+ transport system membrane component KefB